MVKSNRNLVRERFRLLVSGDESQLDLGEAALLIAAERYPLLDVSLYLERLDRIADRLDDPIKMTADPDEKVAALNQLLFEELGFQGNAGNYYDLRNSFLNDVIDRRTGIPITLAIVYMEVARRIGLEVKGVGMPYHFLTRFDGDGGTIFIDVFHSGCLLTEPECLTMLSDLGKGQLIPEPRHLAAVSKKQILTRVLANLLSLYAGQQDYRNALAVVERQMLVNPDSPQHQRDYGLLLSADGQYKQAIEEMERFLQRIPEGEDADNVRKQLSIARRLHARLN